LEDIPAECPCTSRRSMQIQIGFPESCLKRNVGGSKSSPRVSAAASPNRLCPRSAAGLKSRALAPYRIHVQQPLRFRDQEAVLRDDYTGCVHNRVIRFRSRPPVGIPERVAESLPARQSEATPALHGEVHSKIWEKPGVVGAARRLV
jgi:hypothetical protein